MDLQTALAVSDELRVATMSELAKECERHVWTATLRLGRRKLSTAFRTGTAVDAPTVADVVSSLLLDARCGEQTFEDYCADFGYDSDSRKAEAIWKRCKAMAPRVVHFFGEDNFEALSRLEH